MEINGNCEAAFAEVREEFERNFAERGELGASLCVYVDGERVVDLWGGVADRDSGRPWQEDTIGVVMSATKGASALCAHMLADRGLLGLDDPVSRHWPEFGRRGKEEITLRQVLTHQSGVCHVSPPVPADGFYDWDLMMGLIEDSEPFWEPGTRTGYHPFTPGFIVGELVRRKTGESLGSFFAREVAAPLDLDFWIGLPEEHEPRVATGEMWDLEGGDPLPPSVQAAIADPTCLQATVGGNDGGWFQETWDTRAAHAAELPSAGGVANGRGLAGMYLPLSLGGAVDGTRLLGAEAVAGLRLVRSATDVDAYLLSRSAYSLGFSKSWDNRQIGGNNSVIIGEDAFGAPGGGGHMGFCDPNHRLAFGYTMNKMGLGIGLNPRGQSLIDATYRALGSPTSEPGCWIRPEAG